MMTHSNHTHGRALKNDYWPVDGEHWKTALNRFLNECTDIQAHRSKYVKKHKGKLAAANRESVRKYKAKKKKKQNQLLKLMILKWQ